MLAHNETWLRCRVTPGMFDHELGVEGREFDNAVWSMFAPKESVDPAGNVVRGGIDGWIRVQVVDRNGDRVLVELPGQTFQGIGSGSFITVTADQLQTRPQKQPA